jgi:hypothetical protein
VSKIVRYTLTRDGKIPAGIVDGGMFAVPNGGRPPQDYDLIGIAEDSYLEMKEMFLVRQSLRDYVAANIPPPASESAPPAREVQAEAFWDSQGQR